ncbi:MAG: type IX secretion component PorD family protein [Candidatus Kapaibacteriales bacterium]
MIYLFLIAILISLSFPTSIISQEIHANISVNLELVPFEQRLYLSTFKDDLERYINNQKFLEKDWEGKPIPVDINIVVSSLGERKYSAKMAIVARRVIDSPNEDENYQIPHLRIIENNWSFEYNFGANLTYNLLRFDRVCSIIDFYMLLVIGIDLDSYGEIAGTEAFEKAKSIVQLAASQNIEGFQTYSEPGAFTKYNLVRELTDPRFYELRKIFFSFYVDGFDKLAYNKNEGMENLISSLKALAEFKRNKLVESSILLQLFFDTHYQTLATLFNGYSQSDVFDVLMYLDPTHSMLYLESKEGKLK